MTEAASYPGSLDTLPDYEAKQDVVDKAIINRIQNILEAIEGELGTDVAGSAATLKARLAISIADDGSVQHGTSFPGTPVANQVFTRTDQDILYRRNSGDTAWVALGALGNCLFCFAGCEGATNTAFVVGTDGSLAPPIPTGFAYWAMSGTSYKTILPVFKWVRVAGVNTVTIYARIWQEGGGLATPYTNQATLNVDIGGQSNTASCPSDETSPYAVSFTIDVSSLSVGTAYNVTIQLKHTNTDDGGSCYLSSLVAYGS